LLFQKRFHGTSSCEKEERGMAMTERRMVYTALDLLLMPGEFLRRTHRIKDSLVHRVKTINQCQAYLSDGKKLVSGRISNLLKVTELSEGYNLGLD
jgi:hypothetical protein